MSSDRQGECKTGQTARVGPLLAAAITAQLPIMMTIVLWNFNDARLEALTFSDVVLMNSPSTIVTQSLPVNLARTLGGLMWLALTLGLFSYSALYWGSSRFRSIRYVGLLCGILAVWLAIFTQWDRIAWLGHRARASAIVEQLAPIAVELHNGWPNRDGRSDALGPFMAYPNGSPRTLILLTALPIGNQFGSLAAIDRGKDGHLRFELSRGADSLWLEWSPGQAALDNDKQHSIFANGIGARYQRTDSIPINAHWVVSRYE